MADAFADVRLLGPPVTDGECIALSEHEIVHSREHLQAGDPPVGCVVAIVGHDLIHEVQRWLSYLVPANFVLLTAAVLYEAPLGSILHGGGFTWSAFLAQFGASAGYQIAIAPIVSDYTRCLRRDVPSRSIVAAVSAGSTGSASTAR